MVMYHTVVREELHDMLSWYIGCKTDFQVSPGKLGKYFKRYLPEDLYRLYEKTYSDGQPEHFFFAVETACGLFRQAAKAVGTMLGYVYNQQDDDGIMEYLRMVRAGDLSEKIKMRSLQNWQAPRFPLFDRKYKGRRVIKFRPRLQNRRLRAGDIHSVGQKLCLQAYRRVGLIVPSALPVFLLHEISV